MLLTIILILPLIVNIIGNPDYHKDAYHDVIKETLTLQIPVEYIHGVWNCVPAGVLP